MTISRFLLLPLLLLALAGPVFGSTAVKNARAVCTLMQDNPGAAEYRNGLKNVIPSIKSKEQQNQLMAIFYLGSLHAGDGSASQSSKSWLMKNEADSKLLERITAGNLSADCSTCNGSGQRLIECSRCKGSKKCTGCGGAGMKEFGLTKDRFKCQSCKGGGG